MESLIDIIDHKAIAAKHTAIAVIGAATTEIKKLAAEATTELPKIEAVITNPVIGAIANQLPGGTQVLATVTDVLNEFQSALAKANTTNVLNALQLHASAMVTQAITGTEGKLDEFIADIAKLLGIK